MQRRGSESGNAPRPLGAPGPPAEFCHFLSGRAIFTPEEGEPVIFGAGDVAHFPENSRGVWEIVETSRKIFMLLDEERDS